MWHRGGVKVASPYPALLASAFEEAARRLGVSVSDIVNVARSENACRDGKLFDEGAFREAFPDDGLPDLLPRI